MTGELYEGVMGQILKVAGVKHFTARELCPVGKRANGSGPALQVPPVGLLANIAPTVQLADWLRERLGPLVVNSGYRDPAYNRAVGGAPESLHMAFCALDLRPLRATTTELAVLAAKHPDAEHFGIGRYAGFVHVDTRGRLGRTAPARWTG